MQHLFIIEGIDGAGKTTQVSLLRQKLEEDRYAVRQIKLPNYEYAACAPVKLYLSGEFGQGPDDVNAYAASSFFAVDRYAYYKKFWSDDYLAGKIILSDRYVSSNLIHQCVKLAPEDRESYIEWLYDFEYEKMRIPRPDAVFYLDVPPRVTSSLMSVRYEGDDSKRDIHEKDLSYLQRCYDMGIWCCQNLGFQRVRCVDQGKMLPKEVIAEEIYQKIRTYFHSHGV